MALTNHRFEGPYLDLICQARGSADLTAALWRSELSRRLLLFRSVVDLVTDDPRLLGPLPPLAGSLDLLKEVDRLDGALVRRLLLHPQVGSWAAYVVRRSLRGLVPTDAPHWVDVGVLHALAFVAAVRQGRDWATVVPARDGRAMFPGFGMAVFPGQRRWGMVEAATDGREVTFRCDGEVLTLPGDDAGAPGDAEWWELSRLRVGDGPALAVTLDDIDPYRDLDDPVEPQRLSTADRKRWGSLLGEAWDVLCADHRDSAEAMAGGVVSLVPLPDGDEPETRSASTGEAFGSVLLTEPGDGVAMAVALIHEFAHIQLGGLLHLRPVTSGGEEETQYAPWRDDPRPLPGLVQGIYAFVSISAFWRKRARASRSPADEFEYALTLLQVSQALRPAAGSEALTEIGERLIAGLTDRVSQWEFSTLTDVPVRAAELVAGTHRAGWRVRHLRPAEEAVNGLVAAWRNGDPPAAVDPGYSVEAGGKRWSQGRLALTRRWVAHGDATLPARLRELGADDDYVHLLRGEREAAAEAYGHRIRADPDDADAWSGLSQSTGEPAATVLREHSALIRELRRGIGAPAPDPVTLANWLALRVPVLPENLLER